MNLGLNDEYSRIVLLKRMQIIQDLFMILIEDLFNDVCRCSKRICKDLILKHILDEYKQVQKGVKSDIDLDENDMIELTKSI